MRPPTTDVSSQQVTRLTPPGRGAVATLRIRCSTDDARQGLDDAFVAANGISLADAPLNRVLYGSWRGEDVVAVRISESEWEVCCHGGDAAVQRIADDFSTASLRACAPQSAFDQLLLQARTTKTARLILAQAGGLLDDALAAITETSSADEKLRRINDLMQWETVARHLTEPWQVVIAGPPNAGKSSLLNTIVGYERSIVFDEPGTTRDAVRTELILAGWPFRFVDTAGIREHTDDTVEALGIDRARELLRSADLVLIAVDRAVGWTSSHDTIVAQIPSTAASAIVVCKQDAGGPSELNLPADIVHTTSAQTGRGIRDLVNWIPRMLIPEEPTLETALPVAGAVETCRLLLSEVDGRD